MAGSSLSDLQRVQLLINLYQQQLLRGCGSPDCKTPTCYTNCKSKNDKPTRKLSLASARAAAFYLTDTENPESRLCPHIIVEVLNRCPTESNRPQAVGVDQKGSRELWLSCWTFHENKMSLKREATKQDPSSFSQQLFNARSVDTFLNFAISPPLHHSLSIKTPHHWLLDAEKGLLTRIASFRMHKNPAGVADGIINAMSALRRFHTYTIRSVRNRQSVDADSSFYSMGQPKLTGREHEEILENPDPIALRLTSNLARILNFLRRSSSNSLLKELGLEDSPKREKSVCAEERLYSQIFQRLIQDRKSVGDFQALAIYLEPVFKKNWDENTIISENSCASAALSIWNILLKLEYLSNVTLIAFRLHIRDPMKAALHWMTDRDAGQRGHVNLLDYPWIIAHRSQAKYFRALCFYHMSDAVDDARLNVRLLYNSVSSLITDSRPPPQGPSLQSGRLQMAMSRYLTLQVYRSTILSDALDELWRRQHRELFRPLRVKLLDAGEVGVDQGGLAQEFFRLILIEAFKPAYGIFTVDERTHMAWFDPKSLEPLFKYEMLGLIMALAIFNGFTLPVTFPLALYTKLCGLPVMYIHIKDGWPDLAAGLEQLQHWTDGDVSDVFIRSYTFTFEAFGKMVHVDMTKTIDIDNWSPIEAMASSESSEDNAPLVTNATRDRYIDDYISWLTNKSIRKKYDAFAKGFHTVLSPRLLRTVIPEVLQKITEGEQIIDTKALERHARYDAGYCSHRSYIMEFWAIVHSFDDKRKKQLLQFVTASDRVPVTGIESVDFIVQRHGGDTESLPTSVTCYGRLLLPEYASKEKLRRKLELAMENSIGFGLS